VLVQQSIEDWLEDLASAAPAPGGGAAAALLAATGAALVSMVTNLTIGNPKYAEHDADMISVRDRVTALRAEAIQLAEDDAAAFSAVIAAYKLPKDTAGRADTIQYALAGAARVPLELAKIAADVIASAEAVLPGANPNVLSDVAVAADSARAALTSAAVNVRINIAALKDPGLAAALGQELDGYLTAVAVADRVSAIVLRRIGGSAA
jgi:methenyltetrahydrofolate cyclohydrolase